MTLERWTGPLALGPFRFRQEGGGRPEPLTLRAGEDGVLRDAQARAFASSEELQAASLSWRGLPAVIVEGPEGVSTAVWADARGIDTPERFLAALLR